jgi:RHS repeat-associated protein
MSVASTGTTPTPFGFAGQHGYQNDSVTGLMRLGHRFYDASVGRFLSRDPIHDGYNWFTYVNNDPVNSVDPEGLKGKTLEELIRDFNRVYYPKSRREKREYGAAILPATEGGGYKLGPVQTGTQDSVTIKHPAGTVGTVHTHPNNEGEPMPEGGSYYHPSKPSRSDRDLPGTGFIVFGDGFTRFYKGGKDLVGKF